MLKPPDPSTTSRLSFVEDAEAARLLERHFGLTGVLERLPGERDQNYRVEIAEGGRCVFKVVAADEPAALLELQNRVLDRLAASTPDLAVQRVCRTVDGEPMAWAETASGTRHALRVLSYLPGDTLANASPRSSALLASLGALLGRLHQGLESFDDPDAVREDFAWDLLRAVPIMEDGAGNLGHPDRETLIERVRKTFLSEVEPRKDVLPMGVIHGDANDHNVLVSPPSDVAREVTGLLDFGDLMHGPWVADLAIASAYACLGTPDPLAACAEVARGYHATRPLSEVEVDVLFALIQARLGVSVVVSAGRSAEERADPYLSVSEAPAWHALEVFDAVHHSLGRGVLRSACGLSAIPGSPAVVDWLEAHRSEAGSLVDTELDDSSTIVFDLSPASLEVERLDKVLDAERFTELLFGRMEAEGARFGIGRYDEPRLWYASDEYAGSGGEFPERRTVHTAIDLFAEPGTPILSPVAGVVHSFRNNAERLDYGPTIILEHRPSDGPTFWTLFGHLTEDSLEGLEPGVAVAKGDIVGRIGSFPENGDWAPHLHFQIITDLLGWEGSFPGVALPSQMPVWRSISPDPAHMLELPSGSTYTPELDAKAIESVRSAHLGPNLSLSYSRPLYVVRGWRQHLYTEDGQAWLDCVNNVCHVGHAHPDVVAAAHRQAAVLNTNTRYLHPNVVRYAERLSSILPDPLEVCFFTNSGSEANELAIRLARTFTGRRDLVVVGVGYHGNTGAVVEASPYKFDGPGGSGRPEHVHVAPLPDTFRGPYRAEDPDHAERYAAGVEAALEAAGEGGGAAAFLHESLLSCAGQIELPAGYLELAYAAARERGTVCIADEVQVGFGRVGSHFWGFETQGVVPDIVTMGKPIGNGHPLGAVVTTREIAEAFANGMEYFNTFGGNPVSCAVGLAVLDVIEREGLQERAESVGAYLETALNGLRQQHPVIGDVRGRGLFLGIEFVRDLEDREPLPEVASYVVERLKEHGILLSTDGADHNVIKIKPPLVFDESDADRVVDALRRVLAEDYVRHACREVRDRA